MPGCWQFEAIANSEASRRTRVNARAQFGELCVPPFLFTAMYCVKAVGGSGLHKPKSSKFVFVCVCVCVCVCVFLIQLMHACIHIIRMVFMHVIISFV